MCLFKIVKIEQNHTVHISLSSVVPLTCMALYNTDSLHHCRDVLDRDVLETDVPQTRTTERLRFYLPTRVSQVFQNVSLANIT